MNTRMSDHFIEKSFFVVFVFMYATLGEDGFKDSSKLFLKADLLPVLIIIIIV